MKRYLAILVLLPLLAMGGRQQGMGPGPGMPASAGGGGNPTLIQNINCFNTCSFSSITAGNTIVAFIYMVNPNDDVSVSGNVSGTLTHASACSYSNMDAWYKTGSTGGDTSITATSNHNYVYMVVFELHNATTFNSCATIYSSTASAFSYGPSITPPAHSFNAEANTNDCSLDSLTSSTISQGWAEPSSFTGTGNPVTYLILSSSSTVQSVWNNHNANTCTTHGISITFTP